MLEAQLVSNMVVEPRKDHDSSRELKRMALNLFEERAEIKFARGRWGGLRHKSPSLPSRQKIMILGSYQYALLGWAALPGYYRCVT